MRNIRMNIEELTNAAWELYPSEIISFSEDADADEIFGITRLSDDVNENRKYLIGLYGGGATEAIKDVACYKDLLDAITAELKSKDAILTILDEDEKVSTNSRILDDYEFMVAFRVTGRIHIPVRGVNSVRDAMVIAEELCNEKDFGALEDIDYEVRWVEDPKGCRTEA